MKKNFLKIGTLSFLLAGSVLLAGAITPAFAEEEPKKEKAKEEKSEADKSRYGDPATCAALLNDNAYAGDNEVFKYMVPGKDSWVFRSRQDLKTEFKVSEQDIELYQKFSGMLKQRGIDLILAYIPTRGMLGSKYVLRQSAHDKDYDPALAIKNYDALIKTLRDKGIHIVGDAHPEAPDQYFNHADQHWTVNGARSMAKAVASYIKTNIPMAAKLPAQQFETTVGKKVTYDGRFGEFVQKACNFRPQPESDIEVNTKPVGQTGNEKELFGDIKMPLVTLVGTSNSIRDEFKSNFDGYLKQELSLDIFNAAIPGGGMDDSLMTYLSSSEYKQYPPKILIWEIPGYYDLGGAGMDETIRQAMASVGGFCEKPIVEFAKQKVEGKKIKLFEKLDSKKIAVNNAYIVLQFDEEVTKDFTMSVKTDDGKVEKYEFEKRKEGDGRIWYYLPKQGRDGVFSSATISVKPGIAGLNLQARLCPLVI